MMKINVRMGIIALFIGFFILIGGLIISTNYLILDNVLFKVTQRSLSHIAQRIALQVQNYLRPMEERVNISKELIGQKIIEPGASDKFRKFLLKIIADNPALYSAYWGDPKGNLYLVERNGPQKFLSETILRETNPSEMLEGMLDTRGEYIAPVKHLPVTFDPRVRPWYVSAEKMKTNSWTLYLFKTFLDEKPTMGVTSAVPIYSEDGKLKGVFGMDMTLTSLSEYLLNLKISKNAVIFVCNDEGRLIASSHLKEALSPSMEKGALPNIGSLTLPWVTKSYSLHQQRKEGLLAYQFQGHRYLAAYIRMPMISQNNWYIAIVVPLSDIMYYLQEWTYISIFISIVTLLIGVWVIYLVSRRITHSP